MIFEVMELNGALIYHLGLLKYGILSIQWTVLWGYRAGPQPQHPSQNGLIRQNLWLGPVNGAGKSLAKAVSARLLTDRRQFAGFFFRFNLGPGGITVVTVLKNSQDSRLQPKRLHKLAMFV